MTTLPPAIVAHKLSRSYPGRRWTPARTALRELTLRVEAGSFVALLGPNGSGKSTLLRMLATLDAPTSGSIELMGCAHPTRARAQLGVVFQQEALDRLLTGRENLRMQARLFGMTGRHADHAIQDVAERLGVADRLDDRVRTLSGGLRRRVDLARALLPAPRMLLLDEPTTGLDHAARSEFLDTIQSIRRETGMTVILCTHMMDEAERAERVVMLAEGRIVEDGAPDELREALGSALLRTVAAEYDRLRAHGLDTRVINREAIASGDPSLVASAAQDLTLRGAPYTFGPPTLGDVYLARTGRGLDAGAEITS